LYSAKSMRGLTRGKIFAQTRKTYESLWVM